MSKLKLCAWMKVNNVVVPGFESDDNKGEEFVYPDVINGTGNRTRARPS